MGSSKAKYMGFKEIAAYSLGLSTADALRMFVSSFNEYQGFPYQVRVRQVAEPFENEREASDFANDLSMRMIADEEG